MRKSSAYARRRRPVDPLAGLRAIDNSRPYDPADTVDRHLQCRASLERLQAGTASNDDFDRVAMALNVAKVRALEIDKALANEIVESQSAMTAIRQRQEKTGSWGFTALQLRAVTRGLDAAEAIHDASSPMQMQSALSVVTQVILGARE